MTGAQAGDDVQTTRQGSSLFGVGPADPLTLTAAALAFVAVALLASWLPAARAARIDPAEALKGE